MSEANHALRAAREATASPAVPGERMSRQELAEQVNAWVEANTTRHGALDEAYVARLEQGRVRWPGREYRAGFRAVLDAATDAELGFHPSNRRPVRARPEVLVPAGDVASDDEVAALELVRRVAASDVGDETLSRLDGVVDELATAYPRTSPRVLLDRIRQHLGYLSRLLDTRMTLAQRRRLLVAGGWLSLLGATVHIDLAQHASATARLRTAASLAEHAEHREIRAWCFETEAWRLLASGNYTGAVELARAAQDFAPSGSSADIQATAQEGRAWARLGQPGDTYAALAKVHKLVEPMPRPDMPEHHYRYDPDKSVGYTATTLAWLGDPAAESYARDVINRLAPDGNVAQWPRRVATAHLDLALTLLTTGSPDEACDAAVRALSSGRVVPSNHWRASEVVGAAEARGMAEAKKLREAYEELRRP